MAIDIGLIAHNAYLNGSGSKCICFDRDWADLPKTEQDAWRAAAVAVLQYIDKSRKQMVENPELIG